MDVMVLAGLLVLAVPVALVVSVVVLFGRVNDLKARIARLEAASAPLRDGRAEMPPRAAPAPDAPWGRAPDAPPAVTPPAAADATPPPTVSQTPPPAMAAPLRSGPSAGARLGTWLAENWVYVVSGVSLALAGVFLVQYGMEKGWLPPALRVTFALLFGLALIGAAEWIRRRYGDAGDTATAHIPSLLAAAGIVSVFAALLSARFLYDLIGPGVTFAALVATALGALVLGWRMGPLLAAMGLVGAALSPFLTGGGAEAPDWLVAHYAMVAALGLGIDTLRRWGWVSVLALGLAFAGGFLLMLAGVSQPAYAVMCAVLVPLAIAIPARGAVPDQSGPSVIEVTLGQGKRSPFPVMLAAGTVLAASLLLLSHTTADAGTVQLGFALLAGLALVLLVWPDRAPVLHELALLPAGALALKLLAEATAFGPLWADFTGAAIGLRPPETAPPLSVSGLAALAALVAAGFVWRVRRGTLFAPVLAAAAAVLLVAMPLVAELWWRPAATLGAFGWSLHVIALAAVATGLALACGRQAGPEARRALAHLALAALVLVALALFVLTTKAALTVALSVLVLAAAGLDRRFDLPEMGWAVQAGLAVIFYRLVVDPGIGWAVYTSSAAALLSHVAPAVACVAALALLRGLARPATRAALEAGAVIAPALLADVLILRWIEGGVAAHWKAVLLGLPWLLVALGQIWRARPGLPMRQVRLVLAALAALPAATALTMAVLPLNPLLSGDPVLGPPVLNTLALAYALPGLLLLAARARIGWLPAAARHSLLVAGSAFLALYAGLAIRHLWQGPDLGRAGTEQGELYTYTLALILTGAGLLWQAIAKGSPVLRRAAMTVIGLAAAKVFLVDASGLAGLVRVFSFLALGLSLAGLAWLNRWASMRSAPSGPGAAPPL